MFLLLLLSCRPVELELISADLHGVHWEGDFAWSTAAEGDEPGLVEFDLNEEEDGSYTGEFRYTSLTTSILYAVEGSVQGDVLTLTQQEVLGSEDLGERVACLGDYVLAFDGDTLSGEYFPRTEACMEDTGLATFAVE